MHARTITPVSLATFAFAALAACSSSPESVGSSSEALTRGVPITKPIAVYNPPPSPPAWPAPDASYCSADPQCELDSPVDALWLTTAPSELVALGCTQSYGFYETADSAGSAFAVCFDTAAVAAAFQPFTVTCDQCLPQLPAGQIYVSTGGPMIKPNCPDGCPKSTVGHIAGTTSSSGKSAE